MQGRPRIIHVSVPSLRNVALSAPYMHDGRFNTLEEVIEHYRAGVKGRVLRCTIVRVYASSVCYRGAIAFDRDLPWFIESETIDPTQQVL